MKGNEVKEKDMMKKNMGTKGVKGRHCTSWKRRMEIGFHSILQVSVLLPMPSTSLHWIYY